MKNMEEFFQDITGARSMARLIMFWTFVIASVLMVWLTYQGKMSEGYFTMYLGIPAVAYSFSKSSDSQVAIAAAKTE